MFKIKDNKAIFTFTAEELWWLYHHLPPNSTAAREIWQAITQLKTEEDSAT